MEMQKKQDEGFRLTIRNVNKVDYILGLMADFKF